MEQTTSLSLRDKDIMRLLVKQYIREGQPIGSATLVQSTGLLLSAATIRNVLSHLEQQGFLCSPHTSAGRIPTAKGYRFYIDTLLTVQPLDEKTLMTCQHVLTPEMEQQQLLQNATGLLSNLTRLVGVVTLNRRNAVVLRHIEFLPLSGHQVLVVLVLNQKEVQNRIITTARAYKTKELTQAAHFINQKYAGRDLSAIRDDLLRSLKADHETVNELMRNLVDTFENTYEKTAQDEYLMAGKTNLIQHVGDHDLKQLQSLFDAFRQKQAILHLLDQCLSSEGVQIFIGQESGYGPLDDCSVVTAPYTTESGTVGVLGVIGPTRMDYEKVIPVVDVTAKLLANALM